MYTDILKFWFEEIDQAFWWKKDAAFDKLIVDRFSDIHLRANRCELYEWRVNAEGRLAEIIVLDQFSRNMYRDTPLAFASDALAMVLAQEAVTAKADDSLSTRERGFLYMPYMHSESLKIHEVAVNLFQAKGSQGNLEFEIKHKQIIERFGRYPHRNSILGRVSTAAELEFLQQPNSSF